MARPECFVSRWKVQRKLWTPENTRGPPLRGQRRRSRFSGFTRPSRLRGAPRSWGGRRLSIAHPKYGLLRRGRQQTLMSALAHALKEKGSREGRFAKARSGAGWKPAKAGVLPGKLTEPVNALYALEAEGQRGAKKKVLRRLAPSSLKLRSVCKAGRFCRSRENDGRQRLALKRQPPCGGRGCGCRASWPCRRDCR